MKLYLFRRSVLTFLFSAIFSFSFTNIDAQEFDLGADLVSSYVWRGQIVGGACVQPGLEFTKGIFFIGTWASVDIQEKDNTELDTYLGFSISDITVSFYDYFYDWAHVPYLRNWTDNHSGEVIIEYDFSDKIPLTFTWGTFVYNDENYSSYAELAWSFKVGESDCSVFAGMTPWEGIYADKISLVNLGFKVSKEIKMGDFGIPAFAAFYLNPVKSGIPKLINQDGACFVLGLSI